MSDVGRIRVGSFRYVGSVEYLDTQGDIDADPDQWLELAMVRCSITPMSVREQSEALGIVEQATHKIMFRWVNGVDSSMRLNVNGRIFEFRSVINVEERGRFCQAIAVERVDGT